MATQNNGRLWSYRWGQADAMDMQRKENVQRILGAVALVVATFLFLLLIMIIG